MATSSAGANLAANDREQNRLDKAYGRSVSASNAVQSAMVQAQQADLQRRQMEISEAQEVRKDFDHEAQKNATIAAGAYKDAERAGTASERAVHVKKANEAAAAAEHVGRKTAAVDTAIQTMTVEAAQKEATPVSARDLGRGSRGEDVRRLQESLKRAGHPVAVDGIMGPETEEALKLYQFLHADRLDDNYNLGSVSPEELRDMDVDTRINQSIGGSTGPALDLPGTEANVANLGGGVERRAAPGQPAGVDVDQFIGPHGAPVRPRRMADRATVAGTPPRTMSDRATVTGSAPAVPGVPPVGLPSLDANTFSPSGRAPAADPRAASLPPGSLRAPLGPLSGQPSAPGFQAPPLDLPSLEANLTPEQAELQRRTLPQITGWGNASPLGMTLPVPLFAPAAQPAPDEPPATAPTETQQRERLELSLGAQLFPDEDRTKMRDRVLDNSAQLSELRAAPNEFPLSETLSKEERRQSMEQEIQQETLAALRSDPASAKRMDKLGDSFARGQIAIYGTAEGQRRLANQERLFAMTNAERTSNRADVRLNKEILSAGIAMDLGNLGVDMETQRWMTESQRKDRLATARIKRSLRGGKGKGFKHSKDFIRLLAEDNQDNDRQSNIRLTMQKDLESVEADLAQEAAMTERKPGVVDPKNTKQAALLSRKANIEKRLGNLPESKDNEIMERSGYTQNMLHERVMALDTQVNAGKPEGARVGFHDLKKMAMGDLLKSKDSGLYARPGDVKGDLSPSEIPPTEEIIESYHQFAQRQGAAAARSLIEHLQTVVLARHGMDDFRMNPEEESPNNMAVISSSPELQAEVWEEFYRAQMSRSK